MAEVPVTSDLDITSDYSFLASKEMLQATYENTMKWAQWAGSTLEEKIADLSNLLGSDVVGDNLSAVMAAIDAITLYVPSGTFTYNAPAAQTYDALPTYEAQVLGTILAVPTVDAITIPDVPGTAMTLSDAAFSDTLLAAIRTRLEADIATAHTGLGNAEEAIFAKETARQNSVRDMAYVEITTRFGAGGWEIPPGAMDAKIKEANDTSTIRLADSSSNIMSESARLAVDYNKAVLGSSMQLMDLLSRVFDSKLMRDFEAEKQRVILSIEGFKQVVATALAKADLNKTAIMSTITANQGTVEVFKAGIEGQIEPIKAIAAINQAKASTYSAEVQGAVADLEAQTLPEELKLKGAQANAQIAGTKAEIVFKEAALSIETAARQLQLEVTTIAGMAQNSSQMVAAALNGVSVSSSFGWSAGASTGYDGDINAKIASAEKIAAM